jgi:hypothetical protein
MAGDSEKGSARIPVPCSSRHLTENALVVDVSSRCLRVYSWQTGNRAWDIANCSRLVALALDEEGFHLLVLANRVFQQRSIGPPLSRWHQDLDDRAQPISIPEGNAALTPQKPMIQSRMASMSPLGSDGAESGMDGFIAPVMNLTTRLSSGVPETNAGPRLPPARNPA